MEVFENVKRFDFARADWDVGKFMEGTAAALGEVDSSGSLEDHNESLSKMILIVASERFLTGQSPRNVLQCYGGIETVIRR